MGRKNKLNLPKGMTFNKKSETYFLVTRKNGIKKDIMLGKSYVEAIRAYYEKADFVRERPINPKTFEELGHTVIQLKVRRGEIRDSTFEDYSRCFKELNKVFQNELITDITRDQIQCYVDCQLHRATRGNHELTLMKTFLNYVEDKEWIVFNPARKVDPLPVSEKGFVPSDQVIKCFKKACPDWLKLYIDLKLKVGFRQGDMLKLNGSMLDEIGLNTIHGKTGYGMRVKYDDELVDIICKIKELRFGACTPLSKKWFFFVNKDGSPRSPKSFQNAWIRAKERAIKNRYIKTMTFTEHDLRAKAAVQTGSLEKAFLLMGHANIATTKSIYFREIMDVDAAPLRREKEVNLDYLSKLGIA